MAGHHVIAFLDLDFQRAETALIDRLFRYRESFVSDERRGQRAAVNGSAALRRTLGKIDRRVAARNKHTDLDQDWLVVVERAASEKRLRLIHAIRPLCDHGTASGFCLIENAIDGLLHGSAPITH